MKHLVVLALAVCCLASASLAHSQSAAKVEQQKCDPPPADAHLTPARQQLAAKAYRLACESANAFVPKPARQKSSSDYSYDEYIPDVSGPAFPVVPYTSLAEYKNWLRNSCPTLNAAVAPDLRPLGAQDQFFYLRSLYNSIKELHKCT